MRVLILITVGLLSIVQIAFAQTGLTNLTVGQFFTLVEANTNTATNVSVAITANQVLEIESYSLGVYGSISFVSSNLPNQTVPVIAAANASSLSSDNAIRIAGPSTVVFAWSGGGNPGPSPFWATCKVIANGPSFLSAVPESRPSAKPENGFVGFVPDAETAKSIAEAVWIPIYGAEKIASEKPFTATLRDGTWTVKGSLPKAEGGGLMLGGTAEAEISKDDGRIISVIHYR